MSTNNKDQAGEHEALENRAGEQQAVANFYSEKSESGRLDRKEGRVELLRTQALLRDRLGPAQRILDVGGGDGVHATWLADEGHDVEVVDLVPRHVESAVHGLEGPAWPLVPVDATPDDAIIAQVLEIAERADSEPAAVAVSSHVLACGRHQPATPTRPEAPGR